MEAGPGQPVRFADDIPLPETAIFGRVYRHFLGRTRNVGSQTARSSGWARMNPGERRLPLEDDPQGALRERNGAEDPSEATSLLDESLAISSELGVGPLMERVLRIAAYGQIPQPNATIHPPRQLTDGG